MCLGQMSLGNFRQNHLKRYLQFPRPYICMLYLLTNYLCDKLYYFQQPKK